MLAFDGKPAAQVDVLLKKWQQFAEKYHLQLIVEGIESSALASTLEDSKFDLQQGFYWARPKMFDCLYKGR
ncbi:MAG: hypothetical protein ABF661_02500 [Oenococcus sp.]|uniref:EAL domain-containing protein n=1 Tax=Oenococcus sp. TaxID=1979414 RepID=UPI0039E94F65